MLKSITQFLTPRTRHGGSPTSVPAAIEALESRQLLSAAYSISDLGSVNAIESLNSSGQALVPLSPVGVGIDDAGDVIVAGDGVYVYAAGSKKAAQVSPLKFDSVVMNPGGQIAGTLAGGVAYSMNVKGQTTDLGYLGDPHLSVVGINASGATVAFFATPQPAGTPWTYGPVVFQDGAMKDLSTLLPSSSTGWTLGEPTAINDSGQIAALATDSSGSEHCVLLTPLPTG